MPAGIVRRSDLFGGGHGVSSPLSCGRGNRAGGGRYIQLHSLRNANSNGVSEGQRMLDVAECVAASGQRFAPPSPRRGYAPPQLHDWTPPADHGFAFDRIAYRR